MMIEYIILFSYFALNLVIGFVAGRKVKDSSEWSLGSKSYSKWLIFVTLSASFIGGGFTIGLSEKTYLYGIVYIFAMWGFSFKEIIIAKYIAPKMHIFSDSCKTAGDIIEKSFGKNAKIVTGLASVLICGGVIGAQLTACGNMLNIFLHIPVFWGTLAVAILVMSYTTLGGMKSVIALDKLHFSVIMIMVPVIAIFAIKKAGGLEHIFESAPTNYTEPLGNFTLFQFSILFFSFFLGESLIPPYMQRLLIGKNDTETSKGTLYAGIISFVFFTVIGIIGIAAFSINSEISANLSLPFVIKEALPTGLRGLAIAAMTAAILSSSNSFLNSTSLAAYNDVIKPLFVKGDNQKVDLSNSRTITLVIGVVATAFSLSSESALNILLYSYQFWTPVILVPLVLAIYRFKSNETVFMTSCIAGAASVIIWNIYFKSPFETEGGLEAVIIGMLVNLISVFFMSKLYKKKSVEA